MSEPVPAWRERITELQAAMNRVGDNGEHYDSPRVVQLIGSIKSAAQAEERLSPEEWRLVSAAFSKVEQHSYFSRHKDVKLEAALSAARRELGPLIASAMLDKPKWNPALDDDIGNGENSPSRGGYNARG